MGHSSWKKPKKEGKQRKYSSRGEYADRCAISFLSGNPLEVHICLYRPPGAAPRTTCACVDHAHASVVALRVRGVPAIALPTPFGGRDSWTYIFLYVDP